MRTCRSCTRSLCRTCPSGSSTRTTGSSMRKTSRFRGRYWRNGRAIRRSCVRLRSRRSLGGRRRVISGSQRPRRVSYNGRAMSVLRFVENGYVARIWTSSVYALLSASGGCCHSTERAFASKYRKSKVIYTCWRECHGGCQRGIE